MSHHLTQPEETDLIWMDMANHDLNHNLEEDMPIPDWAQLSGTIQNAERPESGRCTVYGHIAT